MLLFMQWLRSFCFRVREAWHATPSWDGATRPGAWPACAFVVLAATIRGVCFLFICNIESENAACFCGTNSWSSSCDRVSSCACSGVFMQKFLQALPVKYGQIAMSISILLDLSEAFVEELIWWLKSVEERHDFGGGSGSIAKLNLTEDELVARRVKDADIR